MKKEQKKERHLCPRCKKRDMENEEVRNALSRRDNKTYICSDCGTEEAMFDFTRSQGKVSPSEIEKEKEWLN